MKKSIVPICFFLAHMAICAPEPLWAQPADGDSALHEGHSGAVSSLAFSSDGRVLYSISTVDGMLRSWNADTGTALSVRTIKGGDRGVFIDGMALKAALRSKYDLSVIDLRTGEKIGGGSHPLGGHAKAVTALAVAPKGDYLASAGKDGKIFV